ncbi:hypothetical protein [Phenylobacterium sp. SCN 70-31]|uniref:hypothetical protein n=1 Tax=Phenylobacterium sp. SCN 70-31 TaxID=1660129 RepID=UPI00086E91E7|nr:hypothetical protein [Phenylobacterium sp. SCN 70-31]ODT85634.1 MAG: hypothetical protein ABS78_19415 [Phenylobacterium sp. SCN 70-31]
MATIISKDRSLRPQSALVYLYELDLNTCRVPVNSVLYISPYRNGTSNIVFDGQEYVYADISLSGFTAQAGGTLPNPVLTFTGGGPADALLSIANRSGLQGMKITQKRTYASFIDGGVNADPTQFRTRTFFSNGLAGKTKTTLKLKLTPGFGIEGINDLATRTLQVDTCMLKYRVWDGSQFVYTTHADGGCPWGQTDEQANYPTLSTWGTPYFDSTNTEVPNPEQDRCSLNAQGCMARFPTGDIPIEAILSQATKDC